MVDTTRRGSLKELGKIKIIVKGPISLALGEEILLETNKEITIREMWKNLRNNYGTKAKEHGIYPSLEDLPSQNLILVNEIEISALEGLDTSVKPGDIVTLINYTHGG